MSNYELNKHKAKDRIKWILTGLGFLLIVVFLAGLCMQLFAKDDKYKPSEWFKKSETNDTATVAATDFTVANKFARTMQPLTAQMKSNTYALTATNETDLMENLTTAWGWEDSTNLDRQNEGILTHENGVTQWVSSKNSYDSVAITATVSNGGNRQGVFIRFKGDSYADDKYAMICKESTAVKWNGETDLWGFGTNLFENVWTEYVGSFTDEDRTAIGNGTYELTLVRNKNKIYVFKDGIRWDIKTLNAAYADKECYVGVYGTDLPVGTERTFKIEDSRIYLNSEPGCSIGLYDFFATTTAFTFNENYFKSYFGFKFKFSVQGEAVTEPDGNVTLGRRLYDIPNGWDGSKLKTSVWYSSEYHTWYSDSVVDYLKFCVLTSADFCEVGVPLSSEQILSSPVAVCLDYNKNNPVCYGFSEYEKEYFESCALTSLTFGGRIPDYLYKDCAVFLMTYDEYKTICTSNESPLVFTYKPASALPADPVKEGYTFVGWYYDSDYTVPYDGQPIYEDTQLYAKFDINRYIVTFDSVGGSAVARQTVDWNTAATLTTPTCDGYNFLGWYLSDGTQYTNQPIKENTTLTAKWERNRFTVTFNSDGGSAVDNQTVMLNNTVTLITPIKTGYNFLGWYMADGTKYEAQPVTDDLTLTARWEIIKFKVTFYVGGEVYEIKTVEYGTSLIPVASELNLSVMSVYSASPDFTVESLAKNGVTSDLVVTAEEATGVDKVINTVKNNKWQIIGGVAGGVALIAVIAAICGSVKRKRH